MRRFVYYHRFVEKYMEEAEELARQGKVDKSKGLYSKAATLEEKALKGINNPTIIRTISLMVISTASLYYKAGDLGNMKRIADLYIKQDQIEQWAINKLKGFLEGKFD